MGKETMKALKWQIIDEHNRIRDLDMRFNLYRMPRGLISLSNDDLYEWVRKNPRSKYETLRHVQANLRIKESEEKLKRLTKLYEPRNNKYINHIIAQYNQGCICWPIEESEFDELPKCMYDYTMFGDTNYSRDFTFPLKKGNKRYPLKKTEKRSNLIFAEQVIDNADEIWIEANKPRDMGESVESFIKRHIDAQTP